MHLLPRSPRSSIRRAPIGIAVIVAAIVAMGAPTAALAWSNATFSSTDENRTITLINQARAAAGLPSLIESSALNDVARWRAKDMSDRDYFCHQIPPAGATIPAKCIDYPSSWPLVFSELKSRGICYTVAGENIGRNNYPDDQATQVNFNGWMGSPPHKAIILGNGFNRVGVGAYKGSESAYPNHYYVAVFTHSCASATPTPAPTPTKTPGPTKTPVPNPTPTPNATTTPHPTPKPAPTPRPAVDQGAPTPLPGVTPEPTPEVTPEPAVSPGTADVVLGGAVYAIWRDEVADGTGGGFWPEWPQDAIGTDPPPFLSGPPDPGGIATDSDGGSLQVVEPPPAMSLLDTIVGGVVASFLGN